MLPIKKGVSLTNTTHLKKAEHVHHRFLKFRSTRVCFIFFKKERQSHIYPTPVTISYLLSDKEKNVMIKSIKSTETEVWVWYVSCPVQLQAPQTHSKPKRWISLCCLTNTKNPFVTARTGNKKAKHLLGKELCKYQTGMCLWSILSSYIIGDNFWTQKEDAPVARLSTRKLHFDKISSPCQPLFYSSMCAFSEDKTHLILVASNEKCNF